MNQEPEIRRNPDGSIDTKYYLGKGRDCRSCAALGLVARARAAIRADRQRRTARQHSAWDYRSGSAAIE